MNFKFRQDRRLPSSLAIALLVKVMDRSFQSEAVAWYLVYYRKKCSNLSDRGGVEYLRKER